MQVLYIHRTRGGGVEGVHINGIIDSFEQLGHSVTVLSPESEEEQEVVESAADKPVKPGLKTKVFNWVSGNVPELVFEFAELAYNLIAHRGARDILSEKRIDFIYERYAIFAFIGALIAKRRGIPLILEINYTSMSPLVRSRSKILSPFARKMDAWMFKQASGLAVVSSYLKDHLVNDFCIPASKIIVVPNAADPEKFLPRDVNVELKAQLGINEQKVIGFVGGFYPWHGVQLLLDAFISIEKDLGDAILLLVGDGPERTNIENKARSLGIEDKVLFTGKVAHDDLPDLIALFDVGVMPDSNLYGSPMKIFEYMAQAKPVIVPDYSPLLDVVENGKQGLIFNRNDVASLSDKLKEVVTQPELCTEMAKKARESVELEYNWQSNAQKNLDFISSYCGS